MADDPKEVEKIDFKSRGRLANPSKLTLFKVSRTSSERFQVIRTFLQHFQDIARLLRCHWLNFKQNYP